VPGAAAVIVVLVTAAAAAGWYRVERKAHETRPLQSLVVLPFENLTGDAGQDYFVDSVTDAVTAHLAQRGLEVISTRSARQFAQAGKSISEMAKELKVDGVV
jgi:TolB-like protein